MAWFLPHYSREDILADRISEITTKFPKLFVKHKTVSDFIASQPETAPCRDEVQTAFDAKKNILEDLNERWKDFLDRSDKEKLVPHIWANKLMPHLQTLVAIKEKLEALLIFLDRFFEPKKWKVGDRLWVRTWPNLFKLEIQKMDIYVRSLP